MQPWSSLPLCDLPVNVNLLIVIDKTYSTSRQPACQRSYSLFPCHRIETGLQVSDDIINMLRADGQADGVLLDILLRQFLRGQLRMGGGVGVDDQALYIRHVGQQGEELQIVNEGEGFLLATLVLYM